MRALCVVAFVFAVSAGVFAQGEQTAKIVSGGIQNWRAVQMPLPEYPESAKQAHIGGIVAVDVVIDETGVVISAVADAYDQHESKNPDGTKVDPVTLDPALRDAAEKVARQARFEPFLLKGQAVRVRGRLMYNFVADNSDRPPRVGDIYGPLLNSKAVSLPQPVYPDDLNISGSVTVHITVDREGNVISADAISGPTLLRSAAVHAAMKAKFSPTLFLGEPVQTRGIVTYAFAATKKIQ